MSNYVYSNVPANYNRIVSLSTYSVLNITNLQATSTTIFNNLNSLSTNSILSINNLNTTSTTIFNNLNSLSSTTILNVNNLNVSGTTRLNNSTTCISSLNVSGVTILSNNVGIGTSDPKTLLHVNGKTLIHNGVGATPANGIYGNDGTRLILWPGAVDNVPYSFGIAGGTLWYAVPTGAIHAFYTGTTERLRINTDGNVGIGTNNPGTNKLNVIGNTSINGLLNIHNGSPNGNVNMQAGSLTIGGTNANYGGVFYPYGNWTGTNTAGILMECLNNTEIVVHDYGNKLNSLMYYEGGETNSITIGRDMGWYGISSVNIPTGNLNVGGNATINGNLILKNGTWHTSIDGIYRLYFAPNSITFITIRRTIMNIYYSIYICII